MVEELLKLKDMLDNGIITKEEFAAAKEELAAKNRIVPLQRKPVSKSGFAPNSRPMHAPPKPSPKVQCPKCGEDMPTSRSYCDLCGAKLPENTQPSACEKDKRNKSSVFIRAIIGVAVVFAFVSLAIIPLIEKVSEAQNEKKAIVEICEKYGLDNVAVNYQIDTHRKTACINSTNFDSLSYPEMMNLQDDLPNSFEYTYKQQNSVFRINLRENTIYKNDSVIYHSERTDVSTSAVGESHTTYVPSPTATKYLGSQGNPPKWILESIGDTIQSSMKDQDVTFWTSDSGVYITIGMPVNKSDFKLWAASSGRDQFDNFCTTLDELNASAWNVIVHQGYEDSAVVVIEVVDTPNGDLILSYFNGKQSYNFLED